MRLVEIRVGKTWYSYLTSVLDPLILPPYVVADLYGKRWRIEEAFNTVKRLLGLSYSLPTKEIDSRDPPFTIHHPLSTLTLDV